VMYLTMSSAVTCGMSLSGPTFCMTTKIDLGSDNDMLAEAAKPHLNAVERGDGATRMNG
jgi:hypothetical protein